MQFASPQKLLLKVALSYMQRVLNVMHVLLKLEKPTRALSRMPHLSLHHSQARGNRLTVNKCILALEPGACISLVAWQQVDREQMHTGAWGLGHAYH
jgi:hypothetical protein